MLSSHAEGQSHYNLESDQLEQQRLADQIREKRPHLSLTLQYLSSLYISDSDEEHEEAEEE